jgi:hypothetical protein
MAKCILAPSNNGVRQMTKRYGPGPMITKTSFADEILETAKAANEAYLAAWRTGYEAGWQAAANAASEIANRPTAKDIKP